MLLPKSYAGSLQVALSTQTTTHTAQQPLNGLRTALKKISRSVNAAFSAVPVAKFEQQTAAAAVSANKAAKAQAKLASGTAKAAKAANVIPMGVSHGSQHRQRGQAEKARENQGNKLLHVRYPPCSFV